MSSALLSTLAHAERGLFEPKIPLDRIRNFLVLDHSLALGTAIHGTPVISAIKAVLPEARVEAAASGFALGILRGNPGLDRLTAMPSPFTDLSGAIRKLRSTKPFPGEPYAVLQTTGNGRTRVTIAAMLSGGHTRVGFSVHPQLSAGPLAFDPLLSQIDNNLRIISVLGHGPALQGALAADPLLGEPRVFPSAKDFDRARGMLDDAGLSKSEPIAIFITQTSPTQRKSWRPEWFRRVAEMLAREYGAQIVFGGTAAESPSIEALRQGLTSRTANLAGKTSLLEMAALFGLADVALTLDTGPMHLARAMRLPLVIVAPAWSPPVEWLPLGNPRARILKNLDLPSAPEDYIIDEVSVEEAENALRDLLSEFPPTSRRAAEQNGITEG